jgi:Tetracyclin repressor-like, C-terminal domain
VDEVAKTSTAPVGELGRRLLETMMLSWEDDEIGPTLRAILLTAAHEPSTQAKLRRIVESSLIGVSTLGDDHKDRLIRSGLVSSQMVGLGLMRYVWKDRAGSIDDQAGADRCGRAQSAALHRTGPVRRRCSLHQLTVGSGCLPQQR